MDNLNSINVIDGNPRIMSTEERAWQYLMRSGGFFAAVNLILYTSIYKYSTHPSPTFACIQLSMPLFIWEILIIIAFCPTEILEHFLGDIIFEFDGNLIDQDINLQRILGVRPVQPVHSCGDIIRGRRIFVPNTDTDSEFITASLRSAAD